eukprot:5073440-Karenia_brevis.AAC.1
MEWGDEDEDMDDDQCSCPPPELSDDQWPSGARPYNRFAAMCENSSRTVYNDTTASSLSASHGGQESAWRPNFKLIPHPPPPPPTHPSKMCNPQD